MKKLLVLATALSVSAFSLIAQATPEQDLKEFRDYFLKKFPQTKFEDFQHGIYSINKDRYNAWIEFEEFAPPYEEGVAKGKKLFNTPFKNGKTYASCFKNGGIGIRQNYPYFDANSGAIKTLEGEINECREKNGEKPLKWKTGDIAALSAYMASTSNGKPINIVVPNDPRAIEHYNRGKDHFYAKRGQLNFACADCHVYNSGQNVRADLLSPALGQVTHFPVWRKKWAVKAKNPDSPTAGFGTLHRRYGGCNKQVRAKPFKAQSDEYKALEYFHQYMSNGLKVNAPSLRQ